MNHKVNFWVLIPSLAFIAFAIAAVLVMIGIQGSWTITTGLWSGALGALGLRCGIGRL